jgi:hypothetical protein
MRVSPFRSTHTCCAMYGCLCPHRRACSPLDSDPVRLLDHLHADVEGQHWLLGLGAGMPLNSLSPCFFTASAASGFRIGLL